MRTIGITGHRGRLGNYILSHYSNYVPLDCDVTNPEDVENCIRNSHANVVLHLAAKSDVGFCELPENEKLVTDVNLRGTFNVCRAAESLDMEILLLSSDHVFSGTRGKYREKDKPSPVNFYGMSKFAAEGLQSSFDNLKIVRTSKLFDAIYLAEHLNKIWHEQGELYPTFIVRSFLYLPHFADLLDQYFSCFEQMPKILHLSGSKSVSWFEFMQNVAFICGDGEYHKKYVVPRKTEFANLAPRPYWGGLDTRLSRKLGFKQYSYWDGIKEMERRL